MSTWFDLSPMRPDEWAATDIGRWNDAMQIRSAYQEGVEDANEEIKGQIAADAHIKKMTSS